MVTFNICGPNDLACTVYLIIGAFLLAVYVLISLIFLTTIITESKLYLLRKIFRKRNYGLVAIHDRGRILSLNIARYDQKDFQSKERLYVFPGNDQISRLWNAPLVLFPGDDAVNVNLNNPKPSEMAREPGTLLAWAQLTKSAAEAEVRRRLKALDPRYVYIGLIALGLLGALAVFYAFKANENVSKLGAYLAQQAAATTPPTK